MTHSIDTPTQPPQSGASSVSATPSTTDVAKDQASNVASTAAQAGSQVASTAADQAKQVTQETRRQAQDLVAQGRQQLQAQARTGQQKAGQGLSEIAQQLRTMVEGGGQTPSGPAADLVRQAGDKVEEIAGWIQNREPGDLVNEVRAFARRKPGVFLLGAALAGVVAGRLTSGAVAAHKEDSSSTTGYTPQRAYDAPGPVYAEGSYTTGTNYVADTPATGYTTPAYETTGTTPGYSTTGTTGAVPPPPYGTVPSEGTSGTTAAGWDDPARTSGEERL
jgi:F0F1-type ATP synthase membrane subunit b/b'